MNRSLPAPLENLPVTAHAAWETQPEDAPLPFAHLLWVLRLRRWKILAFVAACVLATLVVSFRLTPIYESTAVVDIDR
jgi:uncharacterized protein involved in exopolysaccharide biosynthesis